ncbi:MAG: class I tRNA ligase family protein [Desulfovibrionales bacterium]
MQHKTLVSKHLFLFNSLTGRKELFRPRSGNSVVMFTCGPSIYKRQHLGNYRTFLYEDVLQRYLQYRGYDVRRMINFTDVEDKAIAEIREQRISLQELTRPVEEDFRTHAAALKIRLPNEIPRSSTSVDSTVRLIQTLLDKGYAYRHGQDVFFDPLQYDGFGRLFGLDMSRWPLETKRFSKDTYPGQRWNLGDFILWHGYTAEDGDVYWETALGKGRPSWNVQDQGMIARDLGFSIDIHCGGMDNLYRHHDYILAVMEAASGKPYARFWLHGEYVLKDGQKMSKSSGNVTFPEDVLTSGVDPAQLRLLFLLQHYRSPVDITSEGLGAAGEKLSSLQNLAGAVVIPQGEVHQDQSAAIKVLSDLRFEFEAAMNDDLNTGRALDSLSLNLARLLTIKTQQGLGNRPAARIKNQLERIDDVLGILF